MEEEVAELPDPVLFERAGWRSPAAPSAKQSTSTPACTPNVTAVGTFRSAATSRSPGAYASRTSDSRLFDRGATVRTASQLEGCGANGSTLSARLRTSGLRLMCYINTDDNSRTRSCFVSIPESTQTLKDVLAVIQRVMRLDRRFLYARQIFLPDGEVVTSYRALVDAASNDTPVIVGCGEPFNRDGVPQHMRLAHLAGTGRDAPKGIKREFEQKRVKAAQLKADQVRAAGHGTSSQAARHARQLALEHNRELAARLRHEQMQGMMRRAAQEDEFMEAVRQRTVLQRAAAAQSARRVKTQEEGRRVRMALVSRRSGGEGH